MTPAMPPNPGPSKIANPKSKIRLVAIDIDGTLLRSDKGISHHTARTLAAALAAGVRLILATARPPRSVRPIAQALKIDSWQINYNGALIHDPTRRRHIYHQPLALPTARQIIALARNLDPKVVVSIEILDKWYTDHLDDTLPTQTSLAFMPDYIGPLGAILRTPVTKLMLLAPPQRLTPIHHAVQRKFGHAVALAVSDQHLLQILNPQVNKARALQRIAHHYQLQPQEVMAIGDAPNDLGMLRWAGLGVAVANAWPEVRRHIKTVVASNDQDGVAEALQRFVL